MKKEDGDCRMQGCGRQTQQHGFDMTLRKAGIIDCEELYRITCQCFRAAGKSTGIMISAPAQKK